KWLELLKEIAPAVNRVAFLFNPATAPWTEYLNVFKAAAPSFGVEAIAAPVHDTSELESVIAAQAREPNGGLIVVPAAFLITYRAEITSLAARYRVPAVYPFRYFTELGGLLSYGSDQLDNYRRAAGYADKILNGVKPSELPVQVPVKFQMTINLKTAKALGLDVSLRLQQLADEGDRVKRREFITLLGGAAAWPLAARARAPNAVRHVGVLSPFSPSFGPSPAFQAFRQTFHDLGWIEGRNIVLHYRWAEGHADRLP